MLSAEILVVQMIKLCEYFIDGEDGYGRYCAKPARFVKTVPGYTYLCRSHHLRLTGDIENLLEHNRQIYAKVKMICPNCGKTFEVHRFRLKKALRIFCTNECRGKYYYPTSKLKNVKSKKAPATMVVNQTHQEH